MDNTLSKEQRTESYGKRFDVWRTIRTPYFLLVFTTMFLIAYVSFSYAGVSDGFIISMFVFSQIMVVAFVILVIKYGVYSGGSLDEKEFGYEDYDTENEYFTSSTRDVIDQLTEKS